MFLDIAIGIFSAIFVSSIFQSSPNFWLFFFAILLALLPDLDFLLYYPKRGDTKYDCKHRDIVHYPLIYLPVGALIFWLLFGKIGASLFLITSFFHFVHDSIGIGWGIKWLYPFSKNNYAFFYLFSGRRKKGLRRLLFSFNQEDLGRYIQEHGDKDWVKNIYFKWHPIAIVEFVSFVISVIVMIIYLKYWNTF